MARHLIVCRELPPAPHAPGGIGSYVWNVAQLLVEAGETVHLIGQQWAAAPHSNESLFGGRLVIHRVPIDAPIQTRRSATTASQIEARRCSTRPELAWRLNATLLAESLIEDESVDLIEAQEYEAPLTLLLSRRASGLGPPRTPPVILHLHGSTEFIWRANGWNTTTAGVQSTIAEEEASIKQADAIICPSQFLARQTADHYGLAKDSIEIIPYPVRKLCGDAGQPRFNGPVLFIGRLEPRKGVIEFVTAAVAVARKYRDVCFHFVGADVVSPEGESTLASLKARIPQDLRSRFRFGGVLSPVELAKPMAASRFVVVPSRWDNLPNVCLEAMLAGRPVLVTPTSGMAEIVRDGECGWIASDYTAAAIERALLRALGSSQDELAGLGQNARQTVSLRCGEDVVLRGHLAFRSETIAKGARRSLVEQQRGFIAMVAAHELDYTRPRSTPPDRWTGLMPHHVAHLTWSQKLALSIAALRDPMRTFTWLANSVRVR